MGQEKTKIIREKPLVINDITLYHCTTCNSFRPEEYFSKRSDGYKDKPRSTCKDCRRKEGFYRHKLLVKGLPSELIDEMWNKWEKIIDDPKTDIKRNILYNAKKSAKLKRLDFNLTFDDIIIPEKCPLLNKPFIYKDSDYTYSIDRIDNNKGYIKGNIAIISKLANVMKNKTSAKELISFSNNIKDYIKI